MWICGFCVCGFCIYLNFVLILYTLHFVLLIHTFFVLSLSSLPSLFRLSSVSLPSLFLLSSFSLMCLWSSPHRLARPFPYSNIVVETFPSACGYLLLSVSLLTLLFICDIIVFVDTGIFTFTPILVFVTKGFFFLLYRIFLFFFLCFVDLSILFLFPILLFRTDFWLLLSP